MWRKGLFVINKILEFATKAHAGQVRKYTGVPYITHPIAVADYAVEIAKYYGYRHDHELDLIRCIAYLHDVVEDTEVTFYKLEEFLLTIPELSSTNRKVITNNVGYLTKRKENFELMPYLHNIRNSRFSCIVKLADIQHNMSDLSDVTKKEKYQLIEYYLKY